MPTNNLRHIRVLLYRLKRQFGFSLTIHEPSANTVNAQTGAMTRPTTNHSITRAILLPQSEARVFMSQNMPPGFQYGAYFDTGDRILILEKSELPAAYTPAQDHYFDFESERYEFNKITAMPEQKAYLIICKAAKAVVA